MRKISRGDKLSLGEPLPLPYQVEVKTEPLQDVVSRDFRQRIVIPKRLRHDIEDVIAQLEQNRRIDSELASKLDHLVGLYRQGKEQHPRENDNVNLKRRQQSGYGGQNHQSGYGGQNYQSGYGSQSQQSQSQQSQNQQSQNQQSQYQQSGYGSQSQDENQSPESEHEYQSESQTENQQDTHFHSQDDLDGQKLDEFLHLQESEELAQKAQQNLYEKPEQDNDVHKRSPSFETVHDTNAEMRIFEELRKSRDAHTYRYTAVVVVITVFVVLLSSFMVSELSYNYCYYLC